MKLFLFTTDLTLAQEAERAGLDSVIVDWETKGKGSRQQGYDVEINGDSPEDVSNLASHLHIPVTVRINCPGAHTATEVETALDHGARILMLPMARNCRDVESFLKIVKGRAKTLVQIETPQLEAESRDLAKLGWEYVYIGLNDLMIAKGGKSIWEYVLDGTVERIFQALPGRVYGFGGVTILGGGYPIRFTHILHELTRLGCGLSFMRRTFKKECKDRDLVAEVRAIHVAFEASSRRGPEAKAADHERFCEAIREMLHHEYSFNV
ncbi:MAG: hypothetical protein HY590_03615 [Candidatus Omnitrophica bacterium]|nr:hypothetical protein [Candidatus Omnitrophota bacterium]